MTTSHILQAIPSDEPVVTNVVAKAFHTLDAAQWLVPDDQRRAPAMSHHIGLSVEHALHYGGHVDMTSDRTAVATWLHLDRPEVAPQEYYEARLAEGIPADLLPRFTALDTAFEAHHDLIADRRHHYLLFAATHPGYQGRGEMTRMLRSHHRYLDHNRLGAFLQASSPDSARLYARLGYQKIATYRVTDPYTGLDTGPQFHAMWRPPAVRS